MIEGIYTYFLSKGLVPPIHPVTQRLIPGERKPIPHGCKHLKKSQIYHYFNGMNACIWIGISVTDLIKLRD